MSNSSMIVVSSADRNVGGTATNFQVYLPKSFKNPLSVQLLTAEIPSSMYNIDYRNCGGVDISYNGVSRALIIKQGFYGEDTFQTALLNSLKLDASLNVTAVNYDTLTSK